MRDRPIGHPKIHSKICNPQRPKPTDSIQRPVETIRPLSHPSICGFALYSQVIANTQLPQLGASDADNQTATPANPPVGT